MSMATCAAVWQSFTWEPSLWTVPLVESDGVMRIPGLIALLLSLSCIALPTHTAQAGAANPELSISFQSEEEKKQEEEEEEEPDCE